MASLTSTVIVDTVYQLNTDNALNAIDAFSTISVTRALQYGDIFCGIAKSFR